MAQSRTARISPFTRIKSTDFATNYQVLLLGTVNSAGEHVDHTCNRLSSPSTVSSFWAFEAAE